MARLLPAAEKLARFALNRRGLESREVRTRVGLVHAYDGRGPGDLPPMVMLHGIGSAATPFGPVLARLQQHARRVIAPEMPGHGFSPAPSVSMTPDLLTDAMRDALDLLLDEPAIVCGNSLGGAVAVRYALDRPEKVRALVLASPAAARLTDEELDALRKTFDLGSTRDTVAFLERVYHRPPWFAPFVAGEIREMMRRPVVRDLLRSATPDHAPTPAELASLAPPVLVLWGRSERLLPASTLAYLRAHLPAHAIVEEPHGVGHCPHYDDPAAFAARIVAFSRTLPH
jgi:pimeloyl-ACP methyl ester carboxylesterase